MRNQILRPRNLVLFGLVGLGCGMAMGELCGQGPLHDRAPPPCVLNGPCLPNRATYGYYQPRWRRWPTVEAPAEPAPPEVPSPLPGRVEPDPTEEELRTQTPTTPAVPLQTTPATEPPTAPEMDAAPPAFGTPTPAGPPQDGGMGPDALPSAPLPTTPMPNGAGAVPDAAPAPAPGPLNPFEGAENSGTPLGEDPPPTLPPSLRKSLRLREARRAAHVGREDSQLAGLKRLPAPVPSRGTGGRFDVQQASATVWASGTDDIREVDPNGGRIEQAIHHEPLD